MVQLKQSPVAFDEESHSYRLGDTRLLGLTGLIHSVLGLGVYPDADDYVKDFVIPKAGSRGTAIHHAIQIYDQIGVMQTLQTVTTHYGCRQRDNESTKEEEWDVTSELQNYILHRKGFTPIANEHTVSDNAKWASQIDNVWLKDDTQEIWLADTKSNNISLYPTCGYFQDDYFSSGEEALKEYLSWQLSIYAELFEAENPGLKVAGLCCNHLRKSEANFWIIERKPSDMVKLLLEATYVFNEFGEAMYVHPNPFPLLENRKTSEIARPQKSQDLILKQDVIQYVADLTKQAAEIDAKLQHVKETIRRAMEENGVKSFDCPLFRATIAADSTSTTFDSKRFKAEQPEIYKTYTKNTVKKGGFTIKLK
jgi:regulator of replication initiation timing